MKIKNYLHDYLHSVTDRPNIFFIACFQDNANLLRLREDLFGINDWIEVTIAEQFRLFYYEH